MARYAQSIQFLLSQVRRAAGSLEDGTVEAFAAGTTTPKTIWLDRGKVTPAANPYTLDANATAELWGDGVYRFVIKTSTGVTVYDRDYVSIKDASGLAYDVADYASLAAAVAAIGSTSVTLQYSTDQTVSANITIPANIELFPINGAVINHGAYTISYAGSTARWPLAQIFNGTGRITYGIGTADIRPEWRGAVANNLTASAAANTTAINATYLDAVASDKPVLFSSGTYYHNGITQPAAATGIRTKGSGKYSTVLYNLGTGANITISPSVTAGQFNGHYDIRSMTIRGNGGANGTGASGTDGIDAKGIVDFNFDDLAVLHHGGKGINLGTNAITIGTYSGNITRCNVEQNGDDNVYAVSAVAATDQKNQINITGNVIAGSAGDGLNLWGYGLNVEGNAIQGNLGAGVRASADNSDGSAANIAVEKNYFEGNNGGDVQIKTAVGKVISGLSIVGNSTLVDTDSTSEGVTASINVESTGYGQLPALKYQGNTFNFIGADAATFLEASFGGYLDSSAILYLTNNQLGKEYDGLAYVKNTGTGGATIVSRGAKVLVGAVNAVAGTNVSYSALVKSSNITVSGANIYFPVDLPMNSVLTRIEVPVDTDSTGYRLTIELLSKSELGTADHSIVLTDYDPSVSTWNSGDKLCTTPDFISLFGLGSSRLKPGMLDMVIKLTVTINTPGTFLYLGNPIVYFN